MMMLLVRVIVVASKKQILFVKINEMNHNSRIFNDRHAGNERRI